MLSVAKVTLSILLTVVAQPARHRATNAELQSYFRANNERYFAGQLDPNTVVRFVDNLKDYQGRPVMGSSARSAPWYISVDAGDRYNSAVWGETLLHEQCHQKINRTGKYEDNDHGPRWHACMHGLVEAGAFDVDAQGNGIF